MIVWKCCRERRGQQKRVVTLEVLLPEGAEGETVLRFAQPTSVWRRRRRREDVVRMILQPTARVLALGCVLLLASTWGLYLGLAHSPERLPLLYGVAGFCVGVVGVIPVMLVQAFPAAVRFSGISFAYNVAYAIFGGLTPLLVKLLMERAPLAPAWYVGALCLLGVVVACLPAARPLHHGGSAGSRGIAG